MSTTRLEPHPISQILPMEDMINLTSLADSIKANGQREAIVLFEGKILDGNNRYRACEIAGTTPIFREWGSHPADGTSPAHFVKDKNFHRRHLTVGQKATAAEEFFALFEAEAHAAADLDAARQTPLGATGAAPTKAPTRKQAAASFGTSERSVERAATVKKNDPQGFNDLKAGKTTLSAAEKKAKEKKDAEAAQQEEATANLQRDTRRKHEKTLTKEVGESFATAVTNGTLLKTEAELAAFLDLRKDDKKAIHELIIRGWKVAQALKFVHKVLDGKDKLEDFVLQAQAVEAGGGKPLKIAINGWMVTARKAVEGGD